VPVYVRLAKRGEPVIHSKKKFDITLPQQIDSGADAAIVFHGSIAPEALKAREILSKDDISVRLLSVPLVQPFNQKALWQQLEGVRCVVCVEEHYTRCGLGSVISQEYSRHQPLWTLSCLGIPNRFIHEIKDTAGMRDYFGISAKKIAARIRISLKTRKRI
jgi:transketolase